MSDERCYVVCDRCGHLEAADEAPGDAWVCEVCCSTAAWAYPLAKRASAELQAARIVGQR